MNENFLIKQAANRVLRYKLKKRAASMQSFVDSLSNGASSIKNNIMDGLATAKDKLSKGTDFAKKNILDPTVSFSKAHMLLPALGAGISGVATLVNQRKSKSSLKQKLKLLLHNAALGAMIGGGLEAGRVGIKNLVNPEKDIAGDTTVDGNFIND